VTADFKRGELERLGKRGSYRLGQLRAQGIRQPGPPAPFKPRFVRPERGLPLSGWLLLLAAGVVLIVAGASLGWWFMPFVVGLVLGLMNWIGGWPLRVAVPAVLLVALCGWAVPLAWSLLHGQPERTVAREIAAFGGFSGHSAFGFGVTILIAMVQAVVGYWLGRALMPLPADDLIAQLHTPVSACSPGR